MNRTGGRGWEIRLGLLHICALLGVTLGCVFGAFYLGFYSGRHFGFEMGRDISATDVPKLPVPSDLTEGDRNSAANVARIYDKLTEDPAEADESDQESPPAIETRGSESLRTPAAKTTASPTSRAAAPSPTPKELKATPSYEVEKEVVGEEVDAGVTNEDENPVTPESETPPPPPAVRVLGETSGTNTGVKSDQPTLGMLLDARLREARKEGSHPTPRPAGSMTPVAAKATVRPTPTQPTPKATAAPVKTTAPKEEKVDTTASNLPGGWFAQIAAPKRRAEAEAIASKLRKSGFPVLIENANVRGESYFRVVVGPEGTRPQAERLVEQLKRDGSVSGDPFIRRVR